MGCLDGETLTQLGTRKQILSSVSCFRSAHCLHSLLTESSEKCIRRIRFRGPRRQCLGAWRGLKMSQKMTRKTVTKWKQCLSPSLALLQHGHVLP